MYKLFLDDYRIPLDCIKYMHKRIGKENSIYLEKDWIIAKDYKSFVETILNHGIPETISFDHDLSIEHYSGELNLADDWEDYYRLEDREYTGYDCAKWLVEFCKKSKIKLPNYYIHSMNPVGCNNIKTMLENARK